MIFVIEIISQGITSEVYQVLIDGERYAMKIFNSKASLPSRHQEIAIMSNLKHPHLLALHHRDSSPALRWIATELCQAQDLFTYIEQTGPFELKYARYLTHRIMTAVEHMHSQHYVHRDIKAENILFSTKDCSPILADFGFSINTDQHTKCQRMLGTVAYLAPELFSEEQEISPLDLYACDLFNLGVLFFIIVLGHPPFTYDRSERNWFLSTVKRGLWTHYWNLLKQTPERGFKEMIEGLLCFNPQGRWTMSSLKECAFFQGEMATKQEFQEYMNWKALLLNN